MQPWGEWCHLVREERSPPTRPAQPSEQSTRHTHQGDRLLPSRKYSESCRSSQEVSTELRPWHPPSLRRACKLQRRDREIYQIEMKSKRVFQGLGYNIDQKPCVIACACNHQVQVFNQYLTQSWAWIWTRRWWQQWGKFRCLEILKRSRGQSN